MQTKTVRDVDFKGRRVLMRADFNVPLDPSGAITDDRRIRSALPTIQRILDGGGSLILMSHLGRPDGKPDAKFSLAPVAKRLGELLDQPVKLAPDCAGDAVAALARALQPGEVLVLENVRFNPAETIKDKKAKDDAALRAQKDQFAAFLAGLADVYVNDAFGTCHRDNASMYTVPQKMAGKPRVAGLLVEKELQFLGKAVADPKRPFVVVLGGAKVSDKIGVIENLLPKCDRILVGGAMAFTFFAAEGLATGKSLVEPDFLDQARHLRAAGGDKLRLPVDVVAAGEISGTAATQTVQGAVPADLMGLDIGPETVKLYGEALATARTIVWNGPMGVFETPPFDAGTMAIARCIGQATAQGAISVIGGGDSAAAVERAGLAAAMTHISTGGGASLEFLEGRPFAPLSVLDPA